MSFLSIVEGQHAERHIFAQAHEAVGAPCIMVREGRYVEAGDELEGDGAPLGELAAGRVKELVL